MKSTAKQEHNLNFKRNSYIPKMCVDPCPVGSTTNSYSITCRVRRKVIRKGVGNVTKNCKALSARIHEICGEKI